VTASLGEDLQGAEMASELPFISGSYQVVARIEMPSVAKTAQTASYISVHYCPVISRTELAG